MVEAYWAFNYLCQHYQMIQMRKKIPAAQKTGLGVLLSALGWARAALGTEVGESGLTGAG